MAETFAQESELIEPSQTVDEDFICFSAKGHEAAAWANLQVVDFVRVRDLCDRLSLITVPEEDWTATACGHELELVVCSLAHRSVEAVLSLAHLHAFLLLKIVGGEGAIGTARVDSGRLLRVREESHDVFFLV